MNEYGLNCYNKKKSVLLINNVSKNNQVFPKGDIKNAEQE